MPLPLPLFCWIFRGARRLGAPSRSFPDFAAKDRSFFSRTWSRAASSFAHGGKGTKTPPGFAPRSTVPVLQVAAPRTPLRGTRFWLVRAEVPARKIRIACVRFFRAHWGPGWAKFVSGAVHGLRLGLLNQRSRYESWRRKHEPPKKTKIAPSQERLRANQTIRGST